MAQGHICMYVYQCAARVTRHRAILFLICSVRFVFCFFRISSILSYQIVTILGDFGGPGMCFLKVFEYFGGLGHVLSPRLQF